SVGNITLGGTGKTVLVEYIAQVVKSRGRKVAVVSRGYKRIVSGHRLPVTGYKDMGDEPYMLSKKLQGIPIIVDPNRPRAIEKAMRQYAADSVILDDGFQQWKILKDLEIVTIDATDPFGNRNMLPRGILREPLSSLRRADIFVLTKVNLVSDTKALEATLSGINSGARIFHASYVALTFHSIGLDEITQRAEDLRGKTVTLFSGIANPDSFERLISGAGIKIGLSFKFPDHHCYSNPDLSRVIEASKKEGIDTIITTEKDSVRLDSLSPIARHPSPELRLLYLRIGLEIKNEKEFCERLLN
ncbi:MAG: tetraacyldisaccharide 4'-kinase, partial [Candidatus Omnitrophota bacterium]